MGGLDLNFTGQKGKIAFSFSEKKEGYMSAESDAGTPAELVKSFDLSAAQKRTKNFKRKW